VQLVSRKALFASVSALALVLGALQAAHARPLGYSAAYSATTSTSDAAMAASQQAAAVAKQAQSSLTRAVQSIQAMQNAARAAAQSAGGSVPNGLTAGGLVVDPRVVAGTDSNLWVNASLPTQTTSNGQTAVAIQQTSQRAVMTWQQFNVGANTTVNFDQSGGNSANGNNWVALNRIDATGSPSQILGQIKADGTVLIINPNGIIFTGTSQINVHTLIASAMDINSYSSPNVGVFASGATGGIYLPVTVNG
jgi:filamentous hemagglutinin family protein